MRYADLRICTDLVAWFSEGSCCFAVLGILPSLHPYRRIQEMLDLSCTKALARA